MRVVFLTHYALPHLGGIEVVADRLARELAREGCEVSHIAASTLPPGTSDDPDLPYRLVRVPAVNPFSLSIPYPIFEPVQLWRAVARECKDADVVHAHGMLFQSCFAGLWYARLRSRAVRVLTEYAGHIHYANPLVNATEKAAIATLGRLTWSAAEATIVIGTRVAREMTRFSTRKPIVEIETGVDVEQFRPAQPEERARLRRELGWDDRPRVLFVGRIVERKGAPLALAAASRDSRFRLVIVGPGTRPDGENVDFLGTPDNERLAQIYRATDLFLLPSHGEGGFPLTAREAMACGLPVILGDDPAYRPAIEGLADGVRLVPLDVDRILAAIHELLRLGDPVRRTVADFAAARFPWSVATQKHLALYRQLLAERDAR